MPKQRGMWRALVALGLALAAFAAPAGTMFGSSPTNTVGAVYVQTNTLPNAVRVFYRSADGQLTPGPVVPTGGNGTAVNRPLGLAITESQNSVVLTHDNRVLLVTNNGSNTISSFRVLSDGNLLLADQESSQGVFPNSVAITKGEAGGSLAYVLNEGVLDVVGSGSVFGFTVDRTGELTPIPGNLRPVTGSNSASADFNWDGKVLAVTNRNDRLVPTGTISTWPVDPSTGLLGPEHVTPAQGTGAPMGIDFTKRNDNLLTSDSGVLSNGFAGSATSYNVDKQTAVATSRDTQPAGFITGWAKVTDNDQYAYFTSAGPFGPVASEGSIAGFRVTPDGELVPLFVLPTLGKSQLDEDLSENSQYLYVLNTTVNFLTPGFPSTDSQVSVYEVDMSTGFLTPIGATPPGSGGNSGLASW
jgi:6-phosphogluconolactonase